MPVELELQHGNRIVSSIDREKPLEGLVEDETALIAKTSTRPRSSRRREGTFGRKRSIDCARES